MKSRSPKILLAFVCLVFCVAVVSSAIFVPKVTPRKTNVTPSNDKKVVAVPNAGTGDAALQSKSKIPAGLLDLQKKYNLTVIPTYDGSDQLTHPKVLYFPKGWNGYQYWMSMTPYPYEHDIYENPSIVVSNDGKNWGVPKGLKNPVSGIPSDVGTGGHYSDPQIVMRGNTMELWYRYNPAYVNSEPKKIASNSPLKQVANNNLLKKPANINPVKPQTNKKIWRRANNSANIYYRRMTTDGVHWTKAQKLLEGRDGYLSMCVNFEDGLYKTWYATYGGDLFFSESKNALDWSAPVHCVVPLPKGYESYHQDMIKYGSEYYLLQTAEVMSNYTFRLFLLRSEDGIHFTQIEQVFPSKDLAFWKNVSFYRSTLFVKDNKLNLYISLIIPHLKWYITQITLPLPNTSVGKL